MEVWVLVGGWNYGGEEVIGAFKTEAECKVLAEEMEKEKAGYDYYDWNHFIVEMRNEQ